MSSHLNWDKHRQRTNRNGYARDVSHSKVAHTTEMMQLLRQDQIYLLNHIMSHPLFVKGEPDFFEETLKWLNEGEARLLTIKCFSFCKRISGKLRKLQYLKQQGKEILYPFKPMNFNAGVSVSNQVDGCQELLDIAETLKQKAKENVNEQA